MRNPQFSFVSFKIIISRVDYYVGERVFWFSLAVLYRRTPESDVSRALDSRDLHSIFLETTSLTVSWSG